MDATGARRRNATPLMNGDASNAANVAASQASSGGFKLFKPINLVCLLMLISGVYYNVQLKDETAAGAGGSSGAAVGTKTSGASVENVEHKHNKRKFVLQPSREFSPEIAWLMSFPNSGTSFTMTMVARASNKSFATNYADEVTDKDAPMSLSIYPTRPEGPYWPGMGSSVASPRELPSHYVLTKTHCGSRCVNCGPDQYVETPASFLRKCASGHARVAPKRRRIDVEYPPERVSRAVHLIRNPLHNIIARYHLEHRHHVYSNKTDWLKEHPNDAKGMQRWCRGLDKDYKKEDKAYFKDKIPEAPCHGEFYKFAQWHNMVHDGLKLIEHEVPVLTVYYEDYTNNFNETAKGIMEFLDLPIIGELREFAARSDYDGYFTKEQKSDIKKLVKRVARKETWDQIEHYFAK
eukprot:CAMPEP_0117020808 /NCGR_PEP_ID=MMETSP0472-20121206/15775_1 /TAXON_ID=693140 ORGANISM="Tiarina fusus, Strain LIS" /NCGR_SAMPLE_ID=MMETSP0472 /ASSEMBLY_ACC=CAM_ASM_000603 /LENGTH=406 /DNA_ID=CAMNT_0004726121 /DNA_START=132 /DNA_END=1352 /DNA_ORIENTATION=-